MYILYYTYIYTSITTKVLLLPVCSRRLSVTVFDALARESLLCSLERHLVIQVRWLGRSSCTGNLRPSLNGGSLRRQIYAGFDNMKLPSSQFLCWWHIPNNINLYTCEVDFLIWVRGYIEAIRFSKLPESTQL